MSQSSVVDRQIATYLRPDRCKADAPVDYCGRFVLPLDSVWFEYPSDQGIKLMLPGKIRSIVSDTACVEPEVGLQNLFDIDHFLLYTCRVVRMPNSGYLSHVLGVKFADINDSVIQKHKNLTINGRRLNAY